MNSIYKKMLAALFFSATALSLTSCAAHMQVGSTSSSYDYTEYQSRLPPQIDTNGKKVVVVDPNVNAWGAYDADGQLIRGGIATAGGKWCDDINEPCQTTPGEYKITSLGDSECYSKKYPLPDGGGLMPYCMFFHNGMALHGSPDAAVVEQNISHGCVRMRIPDAEWLRYNFAQVGTKVVVLNY